MPFISGSTLVSTKEINPGKLSGIQVAMSNNNAKSTCPVIRGPVPWQSR